MGGGGHGDRHVLKPLPRRLLGGPPSPRARHLGRVDREEDRKENSKTGHRRPSPCVCSISRTSGTQTNMTEDSEPLKHC